VSRSLILAALALLAQGCRPEVAGLPEPAQRSAAAAGAGSAAATGTRLSFWGVGAPDRDGPAGGAAARLDGTLARLGGCLVVGTGSGVRVQPVFPAGKARWDEAAGTLIFAGRTYRPGERIILGGGGIASPADYAREVGVTIAPCPVRDLWAVIA
jgi:hypothetical protein